jgi:hypothetical protein
MEIVVWWLMLSVVVGVIAAARGRSGVGYFLLAVVLTPLIGLLLAALLPSKNAATVGDTRERIACPQCAELVLPAALKCPHCGFAVAAALAAKQADAARVQRELEAQQRAAREARGRKLYQFISGKKPPPGGGRPRS